MPALVAPLCGERAATAAKELTELVITQQLQIRILDKSPASQKSVENLDSLIAERRSQG